MSFWLKWCLAVLCGFGFAVGGMILAHWIGSPVIGWSLGWFSAIIMNFVDRAFVRFSLKAKAFQP